MSTDADVATLLSTRSTLRRIGRYEITDDPDRVDVDVVHAFLSDESYWRRGVARERVATSVRMSLALSVHLGTTRPTMVGFARVVTDTVTHAWLDVFVLPEHRRQGLAGALVEAALAHPAVADATFQLLLTADAHSLYARHGFRPFPDSAALMARHPSTGV
jgi:predicted GNAT family acetyltransferase